MGRWLLLGLEAGTGGAADGEFVACRQLAGGGEYAVLTRRHLLCIAAPAGRRWAPTLRWAVTLEDLLGVRRWAAPRHLFVVVPDLFVVVPDECSMISQPIDN